MRTRAIRAGSAPLLPGGRFAGPMPWVIAIMIGLTVLASAATLTLVTALRALGADLEGQATIQLVEADPATRDADVARIVAALRGQPGMGRVAPVDPATLGAQLAPWLGTAGSDIPIPALIDVEMRGEPAATLARIGRIASAINPAARVEAHATYLGSLRSVLRVLVWLAVGAAVLMIGATAAVVVLAARGAQAAHGATIDVMHLMGATDGQVARLFQRRIALDAALGGLIGYAAAIGAVLLLGTRIDALDSGLVSTLAFPRWGWAALALLPLGGVVLAWIAARMTLLRALARML
jgi:cell division transport system permease protein